MTFVQLLEEIAQNDQKITIQPDEVCRLTEIFGDRVRHMGQWNTSDGSLEIPVALIAEAARRVGSETLRNAVEELKHPEQFVDILESSCASVLIDILEELNRQHFGNLITNLEESDDAGDIERLKKELDLAIFGR